MEKQRSEAGASVEQGGMAWSHCGVQVEGEITHATLLLAISVRKRHRALASRDAQREAHC